MGVLQYFLLGFSDANGQLDRLMPDEFLGSELVLKFSDAELQLLNPPVVKLVVFDEVINLSQKIRP